MTTTRWFAAMAAAVTLLAGAAGAAPIQSQHTYTFTAADLLRDVELPAGRQGSLWSLGLWSLDLRGGDAESPYRPVHWGAVTGPEGWSAETFQPEPPDTAIPQIDDWYPGVTSQIPIHDAWLPGHPGWIPGPDDWIPNTDDWDPQSENWIPAVDNWIPQIDAWSPAIEAWIAAPEDHAPAPFLWDSGGVGLPLLSADASEAEAAAYWSARESEVFSVTVGFETPTPAQHLTLWTSGWAADPEQKDLTAYQFQSNVTAVVPEPATVSLLGLGLAGLAYRRWRKKA